MRWYERGLPPPPCLQPEVVHVLTISSLIQQEFDARPVRVSPGPVTGTLRWKWGEILSYVRGCISRALVRLTNVNQHIVLRTCATDRGEVRLGPVKEALGHAPNVRTSPVNRDCAN